MNGHFLNEPTLTEIGESRDFAGRTTWRLTKSLQWQWPALWCGFVVPKGFETDLASVPRLPLAYWLVGGTATRPAILHDYLYRSGGIARRTADAILYEAMIADGVSSWRAWIMWGAVRVFGRSSYRKS